MLSAVAYSVWIKTSGAWDLVLYTIVSEVIFTYKWVRYVIQEVKGAYLFLRGINSGGILSNETNVQVYEGCWKSWIVTYCRPGIIWLAVSSLTWNESTVHVDQNVPINHCIKYAVNDVCYTSVLWLNFLPRKRFGSIHCQLTLLCV